MGIQGGGEGVTTDFGKGRRNVKHEDMKHEEAKGAVSCFHVSLFI
jgi:hypothetical protein